MLAQRQNDLGGKRDAFDPQTLGQVFALIGMNPVSERLIGSWLRVALPIPGNRLVGRASRNPASNV